MVMKDQSKIKNNPSPLTVGNPATFKNGLSIGAANNIYSQGGSDKE